MALLRVLTPLLSLKLCLFFHEETTTIGWLNVLEDGCDDLLAGPARDGLDDRRIDQLYPVTQNVTALRSQGAVDQGMVVTLAEECVTVAKSNTDGNVILNQTTERLACCSRQILMVGICNLQCLGPSHLILWEVHIHFVTIEI